MYQGCPLAPGILERYSPVSCRVATGGGGGDGDGGGGDGAMGGAFMSAQQ